MHTTDFRCRQQGQSLIEGLVGLLALVPLLFGAMWLARVIDLQQAVVSAAREAAFECTVGPSGCPAGPVPDPLSLQAFSRESAVLWHDGRASPRWPIPAFGPHGGRRSDSIPRSRLPGEVHRRPCLARFICCPTWLARAASVCPSTRACLALMSQCLCRVRPWSGSARTAPASWVGWELFGSRLSWPSFPMTGWPEPLRVRHLTRSVHASRRASAYRGSKKRCARAGGPFAACCNSQPGWAWSRAPRDSIPTSSTSTKSRLIALG